MTSDRFARIETLYHAARARPAEARATYLAEACRGDEELRREVESLLEQPGVGVLTSDSARPGLASGTVIGVYRIVEQIGAGGMGEVYRAYDTKLGRDVAVKVLPSGLAGDRDRLARLEREARLLASLNHANIAHVYGVEEVNGTRALVMELVPGPTLADRIGKGPLPIKEGLAIARQIAEALEAAHEQRIIHRDLKPANIKVRDDGTVKVLDFGLAKALTPAGAEDASPAVSARATQAGVMLGTAAYMSPEQAAGKPADRRSDLWAFGVVLFELLTGRRAFAGESVSHVLAAVLQSEPEWRALPSATPPQIITLLRRCLTKDPRQRLDSAAAARLEIEEAADHSSRRVHVTSSSRVSLQAVSFAVVLTAVLVSAGFWTARRVWPSPALPLRRLAVPIPDNQAFVDSPGNGVLITADGSAIVYLGQGPLNPQLYYRRLDQLEGTPLPGTDNACCPGLSPSGTWVAFSVNNVVYKVSVHGGPAIPLAKVDYECGATWASEDVIYYGQARNQPLLRIPAGGGAVKPVAFPPTGTNLCMPVALPGSDLVLVWMVSQSRVAVVNTANGSVRPMDGMAVNPIGVAGGLIAFGRPDGTLGVAPFDPERTTSVASVLPVDDRPHVRNSGIQASLSVGGDLAYVRATNRTRLALLDRQGRVLQSSDAEHNLIGPKISPQGRLVVANELSDLTDRGDLWLFDRDSGVLQRLTSDGNAFNPQWTPNGREIIYRHWGPETDEILLMPVGHSGPPKVLMTAKSGQVLELVVAPDLLHAVATAHVVGGAHIQVVELDGRGPVAFQPASHNPSGTQIRPAISPDGRWLAYESSESGREEIYVRPFPDAGPPVQVTAAGGLDPRWMADSRTVVYRTGSGQFVAAHLSFDGGVPHARQHEALFSFFTGIPHTEIDDVGRYDIGPDGMIVALQPASGSEFLVVQGWLDEVKRRARR